MATIKSFSDLQQSKKLAKILPLETADMYYHYNTGVVKNYHEDIPNFIQLYNHFAFFNDDIPCWSFAALLGVLPYYPTLHRTISGWQCDIYNEKGYISLFGEDSGNSVDACYELILKLNELKLL